MAKQQEFDLRPDKVRAEDRPAPEDIPCGWKDATDADLARLSEQRRTVAVYLRDRWRSTTAIIEAAGATEALRRVRELRAAGYEIEKRKTTEDSARGWEYRWTGRVEA